MCVAEVPRALINGVQSHEEVGTFIGHLLCFHRNRFHFGNTYARSVNFITYGAINIILQSNEMI